LSTKGTGQGLNFFVEGTTTKFIAIEMAAILKKGVPGSLFNTEIAEYSGLPVGGSQA
jgi:hypothetical protein